MAQRPVDVNPEAIAEARLLERAMAQMDSNRLWAAKADIRAVFVGKGFSLLSAENNYRISRNYEFVGRGGLTD